jgi:hypothetical protein
MENKKMEKNEKVEKIILSFLILIIFFSYFFGFYFNENSAGGGEGDFLNHTWKNLNVFNSNELFQALNITNTNDTLTFQSSRIPGVYVFHKLFNPFTENMIHYRASVFILTLLIPFILYFIFILKFKNTKKIYLLFLASLVLLSPYLRTSAIWGNEENLAYISLVGSYYFLLKYLNAKTSQGIIALSFTIFFSSLCVYLDQKFTLVPAICFFIIFLHDNSLRNRLFLISFYFLFSLPVFYLIYTWGGLLPPMDQPARVGKYNFQNLGYALSIIFFYLVPFFVCSLNKNKIKELFAFNESKKIVIFLFGFLYLLYFLFFYDISSEILLGKGVFYKLSILFTKDLFIQKLLLSSIIFFTIFILYDFFEKNFINLFALLFLTFSPILYKPILQEYYDPLIFLLIVTFLKTSYKINFKNLIVLFLYLSFFLIFANLYYSKNLTGLIFSN